jgi:hypothetical protein
MSVCPDCYQRLSARVRDQVHSPAVFDSIHRQVYDEFDEVYSHIADRIQYEIDEEYLRDFLSDCVLDIQPPEFDRAMEIAKVIAFDTRMEAERARRLEEALQSEIEKRMNAELAGVACDEEDHWIKQRKVKSVFSMAPVGIEPTRPFLVNGF